MAGPAAPFPLHCFSQEAMSSGQFWKVPVFRLDLARPVSWALLESADPLSSGLMTVLRQCVQTSAHPVRPEGCPMAGALMLDAGKTAKSNHPWGPCSPMPSCRLGFVDLTRVEGCAQFSSSPAAQPSTS